MLQQCRHLSPIEQEDKASGARTQVRPQLQLNDMLKLCHSYACSSTDVEFHKCSTLGLIGVLTAEKVFALPCFGCDQARFVFLSLENAGLTHAGRHGVLMKNCGLLFQLDSGLTSWWNFRTN